MRLASTSIVMAALAMNLASASSSSSNHAMQHRGLASRMKRAVGLAQENSDIQKRQTYSGSATWYGAGVSEGACGGYHSASDFIVALNTNLYGNENAQSSWCGKSLVITGGGVTQTATVVDACPSCPSDGDLDMSTGLFQSFGKSLGVGEFSISWHVAGSGGSSSSGNNNNNNNNNDNKPKTTSTVHHTSTHSSTPTHTSTSTSSTKTSTSKSTSTSASTTGTSPTLSTTTSAPSSTDAPGNTDSSSTGSIPGDAQNLAGISELVQGLINIANAGQA